MSTTSNYERFVYNAGELFRFPFRSDFQNILHLKHCLKTETEVSLPGKLGGSI